MSVKLAPEQISVLYMNFWEDLLQRSAVAEGIDEEVLMACEDWGVFHP